MASGSACSAATWLVRTACRPAARNTS
jgi:hypothetical protein